MTNVVNARRKSFFRRLLDDMRVNWILYVLILPVFVYYIIFAYARCMAFSLRSRITSIKLGIMGSPWVGLEHFERFFSAYNFRQLLFNTLGISVYQPDRGLPDSHHFCAVLIISSAISCAKWCDGFLCAIFYFYRGYLRYAYHFSRYEFGHF